MLEGCDWGCAPSSLRLQWLHGARLVEGSLPNVRLILTLGCKEPCCSTEYHGDKKSNERCPAMKVSLDGASRVWRTYPFAILSFWIYEALLRLCGGGGAAMR